MPSAPRTHPGPGSSSARPQLARTIPAPTSPAATAEQVDRAGAHQRRARHTGLATGQGPEASQQDGDTAPQHFNFDGTETTRDLHTMRGRQGSCHFQGKAHLGAQEEGKQASPTPGKAAGVPGQEGAAGRAGEGGAPGSVSRSPDRGVRPRAMCLLQDSSSLCVLNTLI